MGPVPNGQRSTPHPPSALSFFTRVFRSRNRPRHCMQKTTFSRRLSKCVRVCSPQPLAPALTTTCHQVKEQQTLIFAMLERIAASHSGAPAFPAQRSSAAATRRVSVSGEKGGKSDAGAMFGAAVLKAGSKSQQLQDGGDAAVASVQRTHDSASKGSGDSAGGIELQTLALA